MSAVLALNPLDTQTASPDRAVSPEARDLSQRLKFANECEYSMVWGKRHWDLEAACLEAIEENWDGYGARPVDRLTYRTARKLLETIPTAPQDPEIAIDPDGDVSIAWRRGPSQLFWISVSGSGRISYVSVFGSENHHGTEYFIDQVPSSIAIGLARLFPGGI